MPVVPDLDPAAMLVFASVARARGVRDAAARLGIPRSTVSRRLAELEAQVGAPLVVRTARRFALTALGTALAERCEELEDLVRRSDDLVRRASSEPAGKLRISVAPALGELVLPAILTEMLQRYPRLSIDVTMSVDFVDLRRGNVDVAVRAGPVEDAGDLFAFRLGGSTSGCWASPAYAALRGLPETPADLRDHECIVVGSAALWTFRATVRRGGETRVAVAGRVRVDSTTVARNLAARGMGIVRTARFVAAPLAAEGQLVPVLEPFWPETPVHVVHGGPNPPPPKVRAFVELARRVIGPRLV